MGIEPGAAVQKINLHLKKIHVLLVAILKATLIMPLRDCYTGLASKIRIIFECPILHTHTHLYMLCGNKVEG